MGKELFAAQTCVELILEALYFSYEWGDRQRNRGARPVEANVSGTRLWFVVPIAGLNRVAEGAYDPFEHVDRVFFPVDHGHGQQQCISVAG
jgi:hypothetical protein